MTSSWCAGGGEVGRERPWNRSRAREERCVRRRSVPKPLASVSEQGGIQRLTTRGGSTPAGRTRPRRIGVPPPYRNVNRDIGAIERPLERSRMAGDAVGSETGSVPYSERQRSASAWSPASHPHRGRRARRLRDDRHVHAYVVRRRSMPVESPIKHRRSLRSDSCRSSRTSRVHSSDGVSVGRGPGTRRRGGRPGSSVPVPIRRAPCPARASPHPRADRGAPGAAG